MCLISLYLISSHQIYLSDNKLSFCLIVFLFFFLGVVVVACYILRTNVKEISILMSVNKLKNLNLDQYRF